ncbi:MAG: DNA cytosine methyltransferase, partial [Eubacterium sp.]
YYICSFYKGDLMTKHRPYTFIDLFAGCGGLSEGFYRVGFRALGHVEINHFACETLRKRMEYYGYKNFENKILETDITRSDIVGLIKKNCRVKNLDVIIGGPPCQSFSSAGRARDEFGMKNDPRNYLFESYVEILNELKPKLFVFENVTGLLTARLNGKRHIFTVLQELGQFYKVYSGNPNDMIFDTVNYGVPQVRKRVIIFGVRKDLELTPENLYDWVTPTNWSDDMKEDKRIGLKPPVTVREAIGDLPAIPNGGGQNIMDYKPAKMNSYLKKLRSEDYDKLLYHVARKNNELDQERYRVMAKNKWTFTEMLEKRPDLRHPKARVFPNSYTVQWWDKPSKTILAHLSKDGNLFIHPDWKQARSISVREAARLMSFPDDFEICGSRTEQFKQIGNAVPVLFAEAIAKSIKKGLDKINER